MTLYIRIITGLILLSFSISAQEYAEIYVFRQPAHQGSLCNSSVLIGNLPSVTLQQGTLLKYYVYSEGMVYAKLYLDCPIDIGDKPFEFQINIKRGKKYMLLMHQFDKKSSLDVRLSEEQEAIDAAVKGLEGKNPVKNFHENKSNPFNPIEEESIDYSHLRFAGSIGNLDSKNGYKDLHFGMTKEELKSKSYFECTDDGHCLPFDSKYQMIRKVKIDGPYLKFTDDQLYVIIINVKGKSNVDKILEMLTMTYGEYEFDEGKTLLMWNGEKVRLGFDIDVSKKSGLTLEERVSASMILYSIELNKKAEAEEIQQNLDDL